MEKPGMARRSPLAGAGLLILWGILSGQPVFTQAAPRPEAPRLYWRDTPAALTVGREARLALCLSGARGPLAPVPLPPVPPMVIMEALPPEGEGEILAFRIIPLEGPFFSLPGFPLPLEGRTLQVPALRIPVNPAPPERLEERGERAEEMVREGREEMVRAAPAPRPPFPSGPARGGNSRLRKLEERSRALWEEGRFVEALAELRRHERDHITGFTAAALRRDAERALGLEGEGDEIPRLPQLLVPALLLCLILAALGLTAPLPGGWKGRFPVKLALRGMTVIFSILALLCLLRLTAAPRLSTGPLPAYLRGNSPRQALAREAPVYRTPDDRGTRVLTLREGQGLLIYEAGTDWAYTESPRDGIAGWIKTGSYLVY